MRKSDLNYNNNKVERDTRRGVPANIKLVSSVPENTKVTDWQVGARACLA